MPRAEHLIRFNPDRDTFHYPGLRDLGHRKISPVTAVGTAASLNMINNLVLSDILQRVTIDHDSGGSYCCIWNGRFQLGRTVGQYFRGLQRLIIVHLTIKVLAGLILPNRLARHVFSNRLARHGFGWYV